MNITQKQFIDILSNSIRGKKTSITYENTNWYEVVELAEKHKVEGLIYATLNKSGLLSNINKDKALKLKISTFNTGVHQLRHINNLSEVLSKFSDNNVPVIVLKGLVVRDFYPYPEQRSMSDADILVKEKDIEVVKGILISNGYAFLEEHKASHHMEFYSNNGTMIELHWNLFKRDGFSSELNVFERLIWKEAIKVKVGKVEVLSLCYEDLALHLCMHMAAHLAATGFGVRQLCDLVLLVERKGHEINWDSFIIKASAYGFEKFSLIMFILCNKLFQMEIPKGIDISRVANKRYIGALIDEIFESGVYGKKDMTSKFGNQVAFNFEEKDNNTTLGAIKRYIRFIFPKVNEMPQRYNYAKKNIILIPVAWIHHLYRGIFRTEYSLKDKFKFLTKGVSVAIKRNQLLDWMEI